MDSRMISAWGEIGEQRNQLMTPLPIRLGLGLVALAFAYGACLTNDSAQPQDICRLMGIGAKTLGASGAGPGPGSADYCS
jgi:hypothetical protein